ncbi:MAG: VWA domain-containing protein [Gammaproteobacteria bacterium]|nr:VWA domain-containing protein [Gammaproteobacteria bacterium]
MKTRILTLALITISVIGIALFPSLNRAKTITNVDPDVSDQQNHRIEVVFVLDTTSSMSGLIQAAKEKIWSIANTMAAAQQSPDIKMGLVAFRDRGDSYVTKVLKLSQDLDSMYVKLMDFRAQGGGDTPESVNQALYEAVTRISWSQDNDVYKVVFLIGDAPPHMDYTDEVKFPQTLEMAKRRGIVINTIQSGQQPQTAPVWQQIAQLGNGRYFQVENSGNAVAVSTPFDKKLSELASSLEDTRIFYGDARQRKIQAEKIDAGKKLERELSEAALARRSTFNASTSGKANFLGDSELVDALSSGRVDLDDIAEQELPETLKAMAPEEQKDFIKQQGARRDQIKQEIRKLSDSRQRYIEAQITPDTAKESLDEKIYSAIKNQAKAKGLIYESDSAEY